MQWASYRYFKTYKNRFSPAECNQIIGFHEQSNPAHRKHHLAGDLTRDSHIFWIRRSETNSWLFERALAIANEFNETYGFELCAELNIAQLTRYSVGQYYDWHMDLGSEEGSRRKISVVVELTDSESQSGGGIEIFYSEKLKSVIRLGAGDVMAFHSFVVHRASPVQSGVRWSLVLWVNGPQPFR